MINTEKKPYLPKSFNWIPKENMRFDVEFIEKFVQDDINNEYISNLQKNQSTIMTVGGDVGEANIIVITAIMPDGKVHSFKVSRSCAYQSFMIDLEEFSSRRKEKSPECYDVERACIGRKEYSVDAYYSYAESFTAGYYRVIEAVYDSAYQKEVRKRKQDEDRFMNIKVDEAISFVMNLKIRYEETYSMKVNLMFTLGFLTKYSGRGLHFSAKFQYLLIFKLLKNDIKTFFIREPYTSQVCPSCFHMTTQPNPKEFRVKICIHCGIPWNRDVLGSANIALLGKYEGLGYGRPAVYVPENHFERKRALILVEDTVKF